MARKPLLHAFFHSVVSLGYIPFALTSVLLSSSSPYVSISSIVIILIAFIPPLLIFPLLCFSYRFLERFECISLTIQRARTYVMLAGSGLCMLVAAHLMIVHVVGNGHNSTYNRMVDGMPPSALVPTGMGMLGSVEATVQLVPHTVEPLQQQQGPETVDIQGPVLSDVVVAADQTQQECQGGIISSLFLAGPASERGGEAYMDPLEVIAAELERIEVERINAATDPTAVAELESEEVCDTAPATTEDQRPIPADELIITTIKRKRSEEIVETTSAVDEAPVKSPVPMHLYPSATGSALEVSSDSIEQLPKEQEQDVLLGQQQPQDKRNSVSGQTSLQVGDQEEGVNVNQGEEKKEHEDSILSPPFLQPPSLDPLSIILMGATGQDQQQQQPSSSDSSAPEILPRSKPSPNLPKAIGTAAAASSSVADKNSYFDHPNNNRTLGYNLLGVHWLLYLTAQSILIFLLITFFLGVIILIEFVLDREDEDLCQNQYLYWSRVVGIATATVVSAVHGSLLSGYVLLEEHTDWTAKAA
ncbi:hypothetical protein BGX29_003241, partial [Mortierella sp. GBA35]